MASGLPGLQPAQAPGTDPHAREATSERQFILYEALRKGADIQEL